MNEVTNVSEDYDDGFGGPTVSDRLLRGTFIRWTDADKWRDRDGMPPPEVMLVIAVDEALQRWQNKKVLEVIRDKPLPDVNALNEATDKNIWEMGLNNAPKPPWAHTYIVYLLCPTSATVFTYANSTTGARIAYDNLRERVAMMRLLRGERVAPLVKLDERPFKTRLWHAQAAGIHRYHVAPRRCRYADRERTADAATSEAGWSDGKAGGESACTGHCINYVIEVGGDTDSANQSGNEVPADRPIESSRRVAGSEIAVGRGGDPRRDSVVITVPAVIEREALAPPA
jgi:hypothetical protein